MSQPLVVSIPQPCHENWDQMTPAAQGRHCAACAKVVIDFTALSDAEVVALLYRTTAPCGRFREDQLERVLRPLAEPAPRWRTWLAAAVAVLGLREVLPSVTVAQRAISLATPPIAPRRPTLASPHIAEIHGRVHVGFRSISGAQVQILGTPFSAYTTSDGHFFLTVPQQDSEMGSIVLTVSARGYQPYQMAISLDAAQAMPLDFELQSAQPFHSVVGGLISTRVIIERPIRAIDLENAVRMATRRNP